MEDSSIALHGQPGSCGARVPWITRPPVVAGAGPVLVTGPYYLTALVVLLGLVRRGRI